MLILKKSYEIFKKYDEEGYIYLSIDGNNRSIALKDFRENKFKMYQREYNNDRLLVEVKKDYDTYSTMKKYNIKRDIRLC